MTIIFINVVKNPIEEMEQHSQSTKESEMKYLITTLKWQNDLDCLQGKPFSITVIQGYTSNTNAEEGELISSMKI